MYPGGVPPRGKRIAWALKGLKVSGAPSPPRTDRLGPPARRTGEDEEAGSGSVIGLQGGMLAFMVVGVVRKKGGAEKVRVVEFGGAEG